MRFDGVIPLGEYAADLRRIVLRMKHDRTGLLATAVARLLIEKRAAELHAADADVIVPAPMHWRRRLIRGVNSPEMVARRLADSLGRPMTLHAARRRRATELQASMTPRQRFRNVRGAFEAIDASEIVGRRVLLVDDILTTGATCSELAGVLKDAGARDVVVAVIARAEGRSSPARRK